MGWIKRIRQRQAERERLFESISVNSKALIGLIKVPPAREYGYNTLTEEIRAIYREYLDQAHRLAEITTDIKWYETLFYGARAKEIVTGTNAYNREIVKKIYGPHFTTK